MSNKSSKLIEFHYTYLLMALSFVLTGYFINILVFTSLVLVHEFGHFLVAIFFKFNVTKIIIYPYGGLTKIDDLLDKEIPKEILIACSGVITQYLFYLLIVYLHNKYIIRDYTFNLYTIYNQNIIFFNLLPIYPLDGSKILNLILNIFNNYNLSNILTIIISIITLIIILSLDIYTYNYSNIMMIILFIYYIYYFIKNLKYLYKRFLLEKYLYPNNYTKTTIINNPKKIYRNRKHLFFGYIEEKNI